MEEILIAILNRISENVAGLSLVDEDTGQLETDADTYPVTFPCVLVGNTEIQWSNVGLGVQEGEAHITVRLAIDCYDDTHIGSETTGKIRERQLLSTEVYRALQCFRMGRNFSPMMRIKSRDYTLPGCIKVYEKVFKFNCFDESAKQDSPLRP